MSSKPPFTRSALARYRTPIMVTIVVGLGGFGLSAVHRLLGEVHIGDVRAAFAAIGARQLAAALGFTIVSYLTLTLYDVLALRVIGRPLPWRTAALASFVSYTISHNLGLGLITGGSARYRIYSVAGLSAADIARVIAVASMTFWAGVTVLAGAALVVHPGALLFGGLAIPVLAQRLVGSLVLAATFAGLAFMQRPERVLRLWRWSLPLPTAPQALAQIGIAAFDLAAASAALWVLLPDPGAVPFAALFLGYALAIVVALVSHVPGGIGVFESVILATLPTVDRPGLFAALIAYRAIYYLLPLLVAATLVAVREGARWRLPLGRAIGTAQLFASSVAPVLLSAWAFIGGFVLIVSGALPAIADRVHSLKVFVPLPFIEASHLAASLVGTGLLLLAPPLYRRLDGAFVLTRALLVAGALFSLIKGFDYEEAALLATIALLLQWTRGAFYRRTALTTAAFTPAWIAATGVIVGLSMTIGLFAFKHVDYASQLWWQFSWHSDASRFLRASLGTAVLLVGFILTRLFRPATQFAASDIMALPGGIAALRGSERTDALLALTGDKQFLATTEGDAFVMYQVQGHSWIVMGNPVGPRERWSDLLWQLRERADAAQGRLLLYQISADALPLAIDLGLQLVKYGEEARVDLGRFSLDCPEAKALRYADRRAAREGAVFEVIAAADMLALIPELRAVSDEWLAMKGQSEKRFSVGAFEPAYLASFDCAVVRHEGRVVAFANVWATDSKSDLSIDLMRHAAAMPYGTMDFMFVRLMQWGKAQGYRWFSLGVAPLAGIEARRLSPLWARAGGFLYRHGEALYGFEGLRGFKDKFKPVWEPRFVAGPYGVGMASAMIDLQTLVGGGRKSAARRSRLALAA